MYSAANRFLLAVVHWLFRTALNAAAEEGQVDSVGLYFCQARAGEKNIRVTAGLLPKERSDEYRHDDYVELLGL